MTNVSIKNESDGRYLTASLSEDFPEFEMQMINSLSGKSILKPMQVFSEGNTCCSYNITDCWSFEDYFHGKKLLADDIRSMVIQLNDASRMLIDHLLSEKNLLLGKGCIFIDKKDETLRFCVHPDTDNNFTGSLQLFFGNLLTFADIEDTEALRLCTRLYREACRESCRMYDLMNAVILDRKKDKNAPSDTSAQDNYHAVRSDIEDADLLWSNDSSCGTAADSKSSSLPDQAAQNNTLPEEPGSGIISRILLPQIIILLGLGIIYMTRGLSVVIRILPIYGIFAACLLVYTIGSRMMLIKKQAAQA